MCSYSGPAPLADGLSLIDRTCRRTNRCGQPAEPLRDVTTWLARYQRFWDESHERLDDLLAALLADPNRAKSDESSSPQERKRPLSPVTGKSGPPTVLLIRHFISNRSQRCSPREHASGGCPSPSAPVVGSGGHVVESGADPVEVGPLDADAEAQCVELVGDVAVVVDTLEHGPNALELV